MSEFQFIVKTVNLVPIFRNSSKGKDVVKVEVEGGVDVVDKNVDVLLRSLVERNDSEC
jgi:hypothetical protein